MKFIQDYKTRFFERRAGKRNNLVIVALENFPGGLFRTAVGITLLGAPFMLNYFSEMGVEDLVVRILLNAIVVVIVPAFVLFCYTLLKSPRLRMRHERDAQILIDDQRSQEVKEEREVERLRDVVVTDGIERRRKDAVEEKRWDSLNERLRVQEQTGIENLERKAELDALASEERINVAKRVKDIRDEAELARLDVASEDLIARLARDRKEDGRREARDLMQDDRQQAQDRKEDRRDARALKEDDRREARDIMQDDRQQAQDLKDDARDARDLKEEDRREARDLIQSDRQQAQDIKDDRRDARELVQDDRQQAQDLKDGLRDARELKEDDRRDARELAEDDRRDARELMEDDRQNAQDIKDDKRDARELKEDDRRDARELKEDDRRDARELVEDDRQTAQDLKDDKRDARELKEDDRRDARELKEDDRRDARELVEDDRQIAQDLKDDRRDARELKEDDRRDARELKQDDRQTAQDLKDDKRWDRLTEGLRADKVNAGKRSDELKTERDFLRQELATNVLAAQQVKSDSDDGRWNELHDRLKIQEARLEARDRASRLSDDMQRLNRKEDRLADQLRDTYRTLLDRYIRQAAAKGWSEEVADGLSPIPESWLLLQPEIKKDPSLLDLLSTHNER
jgi:hypothetical protein